MPKELNIADRLRESARRYPFQRAVVFPAGRDAAGRVAYTHLTFSQLDDEVDRLAAGLQKRGVTPGTRLVLMVRPSLEFISLTFALFRTGAAIVLIDPGMGRSNIFRCLAEVEPEGFIAIPIVQAIRTAYSLLLKKFPRARLNVTVGGKGRLGRSITYADLLRHDASEFEPPRTLATDPAAIIFTSGSTGPPKGVLYEHGMFDAQVDLLREFYNIRPGEIDLPGFPLFALFNSAMGVTTVIPDMDPARPAQVDPEKILQAIGDQGVTQAFGSPAIWNRVGRYCEQRGIVLPSVRRVLSAGAPVPIHVSERMSSVLTGTNADLHTPYGATESLPVASIPASEVLARTAPRTRQGAGTCVGRIFPHMQVKIIEITEGPIASLSAVRELPAGETGEIIVRGPVVTREYFRRPEATAAAKIPDDDGFWHRMGDVGYRDDEGLLWFCGRKAHIVETEQGRMFTIPCEAIFNEHPHIGRSALVGVGAAPRQTPVLIAEPEEGRFPSTNADRARLVEELRRLAAVHPHTAPIEHFLLHRALPVDIRHNVKIFREKLAPWAARQLGPVARKAAQHAS